MIIPKVSHRIPGGGHLVGVRSTNQENPIFPHTAATLGAIMGENPDHIWPVFGALPIVDTVGGDNFTLEAGGPEFSVPVFGLWNGEDWTSMLATQLLATGDKISLPAGVDLDPGTESFAFLVVFKTPTGSASTRNIVTTRDSAGLLQGWSAGMIAGPPRLLAQADQGGSHVSNILTDTPIGEDWRYALIVCNRTAGTFTTYMEGDTDTDSIAGYTTLTSIAELTIGTGPNALALPGLKVAYAAYWAGAKAENLGAAEGTLFWQAQIDNPYPGRPYPKTSAQHTAAYPTVTAPTAIYDFQDGASPAVDSVGSIDLAEVANPVYLSLGEAGRLGITTDTDLDQFLAASTASFDPDGATDLSFLLRVFLPAYVDTASAIMGKRGGTGFAGWEVWLNSDGEIAVVQDGGASGRQDFPHAGYVVEDGWHDVMYVIDRTAGVGRIETLSGTTTQVLTGIASMANTIPFGFGKNAGAGRNALNGMILSYGRVWSGTAITRTEFLALIA